MTKPTNNPRGRPPKLGNAGLGRPPAGTREESIWLGDKAALDADPVAQLRWYDRRAEIQELILRDAAAFAADCTRAKLALAQSDITAYRAKVSALTNTLWESADQNDAQARELRDLRTEVNELRLWKEAAHSVEAREAADKNAEERAAALAEKKRLADDARSAELASLDAEIERDEAIVRQEDKRPGFMGPVYHGEPDSTVWRQHEADLTAARQRKRRRDVLIKKITQAQADQEEVAENATKARGGYSEAQFANLQEQARKALEPPVAGPSERIAQGGNTRMPDESLKLYGYDK